jgi:hypothetical protein
MECKTRRTPTSAKISNNNSESEPLCNIYSLAVWPFWRFSRCKIPPTLTSSMRISPELWANIRAELFAHLRVMLLFFSWAIGMIAFMWMIWADMPKPKPDPRFSFAETLETFRKDFGTSRDADLFPPVPLPVPPVKLPVSLPVYLPPERLVVNGPLPVSGLPAEPVRLAFAGK